MKIGIHITTFNRKKFTEKCFLSLFLSKPKNSEVVIVDNASNDSTKEFLQNLSFPFLKKIIYNENNHHLGYAVVQGWKELKNSCDILAWINNDFLFEPGWEENVISCFNELNLDYIDGIVNLNHKQKKPISEIKTTPSGKGKYVITENVGAAYFIKTEWFNKGIAPLTIPWEKGYTGPGPTFHYSLLNKKLKGVRLASPGILLLDPEYTKKENIDYYNNVFSIRGIDKLLNKFRKKERLNGVAQGITWKDFLNKYGAK